MVYKSIQSNEQFLRAIFSLVILIGLLTIVVTAGFNVAHGEVPEVYKIKCNYQSDIPVELAMQMLVAQNGGSPSTWKDRASAELFNCLTVVHLQETNSLVYK